MNSYVIVTSNSEDRLISARKTTHVGPFGRDESIVAGWPVLDDLIATRKSAPTLPLFP